jgi:hypothetical protein
MVQQLTIQTTHTDLHWWLVWMASFAVACGDSSLMLLLC